MKMSNFLNVTMIAAGFAMASQMALAYSAGDILIRDGIAQSDVNANSGGLTDNNVRLQITYEYGLCYGFGYPLTGKFGIEVSGQKDIEGLEVHRSYAVIDPLGVDLAVARGLMLDGFASYADVSADERLVGDEIDQTRIDPMTLGGGVTYHF